MSKEEKYSEAVGRRKTAVARVRVFPASKNQLIINNKPAADYFKSGEQEGTALEVFKKMNLPGHFRASARVGGGGLSAQAAAVRLGLARAILKLHQELRPALKKESFLTRDARIKERRKFGLKKARKAPQWSKR